MKEEKSKMKLLILICIVLIIMILVLGGVIYNKYRKNIKETESKNEIGNKITDSSKETENKNEVGNEITDSSKKTEGKNEIGNKITDFSVQFLRMENNKQNMIYSPLSIKYGLKMLQEGAKENTKAEIDKVIANESFAKYKNIDKVLSFANGMYIRDSFSGNVVEDYKNTLTSKYNAQIVYDNFSSAKNINDWIEKKTLGQIKEMLKDNDIEDAQMTLINALAIDMEWKVKFETENTTGREFYLENGNKMIATTMSRTTSSQDVSYYLDDNITALSLELKQYDNNQLEFIAIMPKKNLDKYVNSLTINKVNNVISKLKPSSSVESGITISIPKFSFDYDLKLKEDLQNLGIKDAFIDKVANFYNITSDNSIYIEKALHKSNIDFSEKGVKAAAVTAFVGKGIGASDNSKTEIINIDKPFVFFIRDKKNKEIWFVGTLYEPNSWDNDLK